MKTNNALKLNSTKFKYASNHSTLSCDCPDGSCTPINITAYRFVDDAVANPDIYRPPLDIFPSRKVSKCKNNCNGYALSFFTSLNFAEKKLEKILVNSPMFEMKAIANCDITEDDGVCTKPTIDGHFELHEYENTNFHTRFTIVKAS